ncbi:gamma-glutamyl-gamma-aminobutyrate hydrolase family protein [Desulfitobacterium sp. Sab5]|uniref:gamma-glutamyl-gamma-aminobutyrate hydrolase family protein n=1 Tax=Desulfitobacterium nosdiversum TaxID=3375356 RepID=UPI003CEBD3AE
MSKKPIIGITVAHCTEELKTFPRGFYVESICKAGGQPLLIPPVRNEEDAYEILSLMNGLVLTGGGDIAPLVLAEQPKKGIGECFPERDLGELLLAKLALQLELPVLGICRGIQVLAVAAGGKIYQDIPSEYPQALEHKQKAPRENTWHEVELLTSKLSRIVGETKIQVNSLHHQAVASLPKGFIKSAVSADGIIEGIEKSDSAFCVGVQWHPEVLAGEEHSQKLFRGFVDSCKEHFLLS